MIGESFWATALNNLAYFTAGGFAGLTISRVLVWSERRAAHVPPDETAKEKRMRSIPTVTIRVVALIVAGLLMFGIGVFTGFRVLDAKYGCVDDYANELADSLTPRQAASESLQERQEDVNDALGAVLAASLAQQPEKERLESARALQDAVTAYNAAADALTEARAAKPYPPAPREVCGG